MSLMKHSIDHFIIPDTQVKRDVPLEHLVAASNYIVEHKPSTIIHLGDHYDMPSLSSYDRGTKKIEGARYKEDIEVGKYGMELLLSAIRTLNRKRKKQKLKLYKPIFHFLLGNHEERIMRHVNANPILEGILSYKDLELEKMGWKVSPYLSLLELQGVHYAHYFYNPNTGKPLCSQPLLRLKEIGFSFTMGHQQGKLIAERTLANGVTQRALVTGSFYLHNEEYKGPQGNPHWRGCLHKHNVKDGNYTLTELPIDILMRDYL